MTTLRAMIKFYWMLLSVVLLLLNLNSIQTLANQPLVNSNHLKATVRVQKGSVYLKSWQYEKAVAVLQEAIELFPQYSIAYHKLGTALFHLEEYAQACENWKRACDIDTRCQGWNFGKSKNYCSANGH